MQTDSTIEMAPAVLFEHVKQELISPGRLMSPLEVSQAVDVRDDVPPELSGWFLCGNVHAEMYADMRVDGARLDHEVVLFPTPSGTNFLVLSQRASQWEHRFVLPLLGPVVRDFAQVTMLHLDR